jgi:putative acetyltransferase
MNKSTAPRQDNDESPSSGAPGVTVRSAEPADALAISELLGAPGAFEGTLQLPDMPAASRVEGLERIDPQGCRLVAVADGVIIGMAALHSNSSLRRAHAKSLAIAVSAAWHGRGVGAQLMTRLLDWADNWAGVLRVELLVHTDNPRAIALYERFGFVHEGRLRAYALKNGHYVDSFAMARLHPSPPPLPGGDAP